jgi:hypothetical protein
MTHSYPRAVRRTVEAPETAAGASTSPADETPHAGLSITGGVPAAAPPSPTGGAAVTPQALLPVGVVAGPGGEEPEPALYVRTPADYPHRRHPAQPDTTVCGRSLLGAVRVTTAQALVWLQGRRCIKCFPEHRLRGRYR